MKNSDIAPSVMGISDLTLNDTPPTAHKEDQISTFSQRRKGKGFPRNVQPPAAAPTEPLSIEDALKNEISYMPMKTPVSILQELLSRRGITPTYELVQIEGAIHEPTFRYRVSFNDKDAMGAGRSKKEAKHAAAKALVDKLTGQSTLAGEQMEAALESALGPSSFDDKVMGNPIGWLREMCMARRWPPPTYETEMEVGLPHERQFTIACTVLKYREVGQGKSKKIAKRIAAHKMWTRLQDNPPDATQLNQVIDEEASEEATASLSSPDINCVQLLQEIASEHQFDVTYVEVEEKTYSDCFQCLVQLSTLPVAVCQGSGKTRNEAKVASARNALEYLKIMTKK